MVQDLRGDYTTTDIHPTAHSFLRLGSFATRNRGLGPEKRRFLKTQREVEIFQKTRVSRCVWAQIYEISRDHDTMLRTLPMVLHVPLAATYCLGRLIAVQSIRFELERVGTDIFDSGF